MKSINKGREEFSTDEIPEHFQLIRSKQTSLSDCYMHEFFSTFSGVRIFFIKFDSPIVEGAFCLPTEPHNDEGLPHILEHLTFLGSKGYPHKGLLDCLASRCFANGTNAWTQTDHTAYTISTAGSEGFLNILPVYLDHILQPNLADEDFLTEVHHITEDGGSAGVIYSELQMTENTSENLIYLEALSNLYPGESGYKYDAGGKLADVRKSNNERVKEYHKLFYRWDNLNLIISGNIDICKLLQAVASIEENQLGKVKTCSFEYEKLFFDTANTLRPWCDKKHTTPLKSTSRNRVYFPSGDEENGDYCIAYRAIPWHQMKDIQALDILGEYLTDSNISPLQKRLVEIDEPYCSDINFTLESFKDTCFLIEFSDVAIGPNNNPSANMDNIFYITMEIFEQIAKDGLDMDRLHKLIKRSTYAVQQSIENKPHSEFSNMIIEYCINGSSKQNLDDLIDQKNIINQLLSKPEDFWIKHFNNFFREAPKVIVESLPSKKRYKQLQREEKKYKEHIVKTIGKAKLTSIKAEVEKTKEKQAKPPPSEIIDSFSLPDANGIVPITFPTYRNFSVADHPFDAASFDDTIDIPFCLQFDKISSDFFSITVVTQTPKTWSRDKTLLLPLLTELLFESNIVLGDVSLTHEQFSSHLINTLVSYGSNVGYYEKTLFPNYVTVVMTLPIDNFHKGIQVLKSVLYNVKFSTDRISCTIRKMLSASTKKRRDASNMMRQSHANMRFDQSSNICLYGFPKQRPFLNSLLRKLDKTAESLSEIYEELFESSKLMVHIATDDSKLNKSWLTDFALIFSSSVKLNESKGSLKKFPDTSFLWNDAIPVNSKLSHGNGIIFGLESCDSSNLNLDVNGPNGYSRPNYPILALLTEYFNLTEGPLYRVTRGGGYSYDCYLGFNFSQGLLSLVISPASDLVQALKKSIECIESHCKDPNKFINYDVDSAKCALIYSLFDREKSQICCASQRFLSAFKQVAINFNAETSQKIITISTKELHEACFTWLKGLCNFEIAPDNLKDGKSLIIISNTDNVKAINNSLNFNGFPLLNHITSETAYNWMSQGNECNNIKSRKAKNRRITYS